MLYANIKNRLITKEFKMGFCMLGSTKLVQGNMVAFVRREDRTIALYFQGGESCSWSYTSEENEQYDFDTFTSALEKYCIVMDEGTLVNPDLVETFFYTCGDENTPSQMTLKCTGCPSLNLIFEADESFAPLTKLINCRFF
jgi:hypothetical protein